MSFYNSNYKKVWTLVDLSNGKRAIVTKWVYRNKKDERVIVIKNKVRFVAQEYTQEKWIDYDEVFDFVARIEAIRLFLAYASFKDFVVYQIDVKSAFLYGKIEEEVYVCQLLGFEDPDFPNKVYKVEKALYGLRQAPRVWCETLSTYLLDNGFQRGKIDKTLFIRRDKGDILLVQVYVDDIIFGSTKKSLCTEFQKMMYKKFHMSSMGELTFFLRLQVKQKENGIFISQDKYVTEILKKIGFSDVKTTSTPMETQKALFKDEDGKEVDVHLYRSMICSLVYLKGEPKLGIWYPKDLPFDLVAYTDSDYAGASLDKKSTTGGYEFLGRVLAKPTESDRFEQIVDFLNAHTIKYALTVNPTISTSCIEQFWTTVKVKTVNGEVQLQALVDGKKIIVTEASIRRDLQLDDEEVDEAVNEEPSIQLKELTDFCTKLQQIVLDLENTKTTQAREIASLKLRFKKLEKKGGSRTHKLRRLHKVGRSARVVSSDEASLGDQEDASKQGRKIDDIDADAGITLESTHFDGNTDIFGIHDLDGDEVVVGSEVTDKAGEKRNIIKEAVVVTVPVSATIITNVELTLAQTLAELKSVRPNTKGVVMQEPSESTLPIVSLQLPSQAKG
ncbi:putative ribonuclease H-like domain-containing protein [Tanacetum coccineum]|uniref:Ribonuclease H-like domain-containing protein n=1 Tax=Tanacetum coccineum TaxID=301880 RepID=A0ABQ5DCT1_9ASTR